jgi:ArsR family transcriptional regulator, arsenate/arsenite/antimonite-responsive transcriptional repressor
MKLADQEFSRIAKALADPQRCEILERAAAAGEMCCSDMVAECHVSQATISHHLKELATAGLLERRKEGQFAYFRFRPEIMSAYLEELGRRMRLPGRAGARAGDHPAKKETADAVVASRSRPRS